MSSVLNLISQCAELDFTVRLTLTKSCFITCTTISIQLLCFAKVLLFISVEENIIIGNNNRFKIFLNGILCSATQSLPVI